MSTPKEVAGSKKPPFIRTPLGVFVILASILVLIISTCLIGHFGFDMFGIKKGGEAEEGTRTPDISKALTVREEHYYGKKRDLVAKINTAINKHNAKEFRDSSSELFKLVHNFFPGEDKQDPVFHQTDNKKKIHEAFAGEAERAAMDIRNTFESIEDVKVRYEALRSTRKILHWTSSAYQPTFLDFINQKGYDTVKTYLAGVRNQFSSERTESINDSKLLDGIMLFIKTVSSSFKGFDDCPDLVFSVETFKSSARECLVQTLESEIKNIEAKEDREKAFAKYSLFLKLIEPTLKLRDSLIETKGDEVKGTSTKPPDSDAELTVEEKTFYSKKNDLMDKIKTAIKEHNVQEFQGKAMDLLSLVRDVFPGEDKQDPVFKKTDDEETIYKAFAGEAERAAMDLRNTFEDIKDVKERYKALNDTRDILLWTSCVYYDKFIYFIYQKGHDTVKTYLEGVRNQFSPERTEPINDSKLLEGIELFTTTASNFKRFPTCPKVLFSDETFKSSARNCLVQTLESEIKNLETKEDQEKAFAEYSSCLKLIDPALKLRDNLIETKGAEAKGAPPKAPDSNAELSASDKAKTLGNVPEAPPSTPSGELTQEQKQLLALLEAKPEGESINIINVLERSSDFFRLNLGDQLAEYFRRNQEQLLALLKAKPEGESINIIKVLERLSDFNHLNLGVELVEYFLKPDFDLFLSDSENMENFLLKFAARCGEKFELSPGSGEERVNYYLLLKKCVNYYLLLKKSFYEMVVNPENSDPYQKYSLASENFKKKPDTFWKDLTGGMLKAELFSIFFWSFFNAVDVGISPKPIEIRQNYCNMVSNITGLYEIYNSAHENLANFIVVNGAWDQVADFPGIREFYNSFYELQFSLFPPPFSPIGPIYRFNDFVKRLRYFLGKNPNLTELFNFFKSYSQGMSNMPLTLLSSQDQRLFEALDNPDIKSLKDIFKDLEEGDRPDISKFEFIVDEMEAAKVIPKVEPTVPEVIGEDKQEISKISNFRNYFGEKSKCGKDLKTQPVPEADKIIEPELRGNPYESLRKIFTEIMKDPDNIILYQKFSFLLDKFLENVPKNWKVDLEPFHILLFSSINPKTSKSKPYGEIRDAYCLLPLPQDTEKPLSPWSKNIFENAYHNSVEFFERCYKEWWSVDERSNSGIQDFCDALNSKILYEFGLTPIKFKRYDFKKDKWKYDAPLIF